MPEQDTEQTEPFWLSPWPFLEPDIPPPDGDGGTE